MWYKYGVTDALDCIIHMAIGCSTKTRLLKKHETAYSSIETPRRANTASCHLLVLQESISFVSIATGIIAITSAATAVSGRALNDDTYMSHAHAIAPAAASLGKAAAPKYKPQLACVPKMVTAHATPKNMEDVGSLCLSSTTQNIKDIIEHVTCVEIIHISSTGTIALAVALYIRAYVVV
jgi:hypothetical protein